MWSYCIHNLSCNWNFRVLTALHGSMSAPPMGGLPFSLIVGYCQLLIKRYVTYLHAVCCISRERRTVSVTQTSASSQPGVLAPAPYRVRASLKTFRRACCHLHIGNACCAALKQSIMMALAAHAAASPFLIEGMW